MGYNESMNGEPKGKRRGRGCIWVTLVFLVMLVLSAPLILRGIGAVLIYADPLEKADSVVALSGDTGDRVTEAAWLYDNHYADYLFITYTDEQARDALLWKAQQEGISSDRIVVTAMQVSNTVDEAHAIRALAEERAQQSLIIITDPFHTLRTRIIFRKELSGSGIDVQVRPVGGHWFRSTTWWRTAEGRRYLLEEYLKILFYAFGKY